MEYINKRSVDGNDITKSFLHRLKVYEENYPRDLYEVFKSDEGGETKRRLVRVLLNEQNNRCCYCMKELSEDKVTLEHIIVNKIESEVEYSRYLEKDIVLNDSVCYASHFIITNETNFPPYPHTIAYQNLAASCDGRLIPNSRESVSCNHKRGSMFIEPIILYSNIKNEVIYHPNGAVIWNAETHLMPTLDILGLNR